MVAEPPKVMSKFILLTSPVIQRNPTSFLCVVLEYTTRAVRLVFSLCRSYRLSNNPWHSHHHFSFLAVASGQQTPNSKGSVSFSRPCAIAHLTSKGRQKVFLYPFERSLRLPMPPRQTGLCKRTLLSFLTRYTSPMTASRLSQKRSFLHEYFQLPTRRREEHHFIVHLLIDLLDKRHYAVCSAKWLNRAALDTAFHLLLSGNTQAHSQAQPREDLGVIANDQSDDEVSFQSRQAIPHTRAIPPLRPIQLHRSSVHMNTNQPPYCVAPVDSTPPCAS